MSADEKPKRPQKKILGDKQRMTRSKARGGFINPNQEFIDAEIERRNRSFERVQDRRNVRMMEQNLRKYKQDETLSPMLQSLMDDLKMRLQFLAEAYEIDGPIFSGLFNPMNESIKQRWQESREMMDYVMTHNAGRFSDSKMHVRLNELKMDYIVMLRFQMLLLDRYKNKMPHMEFMKLSADLEDERRDVKLDTTPGSAISAEGQRFYIRFTSEKFLRLLNKEHDGSPLPRNSVLYDISNMFNDTMQQIEKMSRKPQPPEGVDAYDGDADDEDIVEMQPAIDNPSSSNVPAPEPEPETTGIVYETVDSSPEREPAEPQAPEPIPPVVPQPDPALQADSANEFSESPVQYYSPSEQSTLIEEHVPPREDYKPYFSDEYPPTPEFLKEFETYWLHRQADNWERFRQAPTLSRWTHANILNQYLLWVYGPKTNEDGSYFTPLIQSIVNDTHMTQEEAVRMGVSLQMLEVVQDDIQAILWSNQGEARRSFLQQRLNTTPDKDAQDTLNQLLILIDIHDDVTRVTEPGTNEVFDILDGWFEPWEGVDAELIEEEIHRSPASERDYDNEPLPPKTGKQVTPVDTVFDLETVDIPDVTTTPPQPPDIPDEPMVNRDILPQGMGSGGRLKQPPKFKRNRFDPREKEFSKRATIPSQGFSSASADPIIEMDIPDAQVPISVSSSSSPWSQASDAPTQPSPILNPEPPPPPRYAPSTSPFPQGPTLASFMAQPQWIPNPNYAPASSPSPFSQSSQAPAQPSPMMNPQSTKTIPNIAVGQGKGKGKSNQEKATTPPPQATRVPQPENTYTGQSFPPRQPPATPSPSPARPAPPVPPVPPQFVPPQQMAPQPMAPPPVAIPVPPAIFVQPTLVRSGTLGMPTGDTARNRINPARARSALASTFHDVIAAAGVRIPANRVRDMFADHWLYGF